MATRLPLRRSREASASYERSECFVFEKGASIAEMRAIIEDYGIDREEVSLHPVNNPASSYYYTIDEEYISTLYELFWSTPPSE